MLRCILPAGKFSICWGDVNHRQAVIGFQAFQFHVVKNIPRRSTHFIKEQGRQFFGVFLGVAQQGFEGLAFYVFAGRFRDAIQLNDLSRVPLGKTPQGIFLHVQRESFALLFTTGNTGQGQIIFPYTYFSK